jgi:hypothetical protein
MPSMPAPKAGDELSRLHWLGHQIARVGERVPSPIVRRTEPAPAKAGDEGLGRKYHKAGAPHPACGKPTGRHMLDLG